jgi:hypothetical protein
VRRAANQKRFVTVNGGHQMYQGSRAARLLLPCQSPPSALIRNTVVSSCCHCSCAATRSCVTRRHKRRKRNGLFISGRYR